MPVLALANEGDHDIDLGAGEFVASTETNAQMCLTLDGRDFLLVYAGSGRPAPNDLLYQIADEHNVAASLPPAPQERRVRASGPGRHAPRWSYKSEWPSQTPAAELPAD